MFLLSLSISDKVNPALFLLDEIGVPLIFPVIVKEEWFFDDEPPGYPFIFAMKIMGALFFDANPPIGLALRGFSRSTLSPAEKAQWANWCLNTLYVP